MGQLGIPLPDTLLKGYSTKMQFHRLTPSSLLFSRYPVFCCNPSYFLHCIDILITT
jgi:hypothetical protein